MDRLDKVKPIVRKLCGEVRFDWRPASLGSVAAMRDDLRPEALTPVGSGTRGSVAFRFDHRRLGDHRPSRRPASSPLSIPTSASRRVQRLHLQATTICAKRSKRGVRFFSTATPRCSAMRSPGAAVRRSSRSGCRPWRSWSRPRAGSVFARGPASASRALYPRLSDVPGALRPSRLACPLGQGW